MQNAQIKPFNRWLSLLLAIIMVVGLIPFGGITTAHAATGDFELPVEGSTGYGITGLTVGGKSVEAGTPFLILGENGSKLKVKLSDGTEGEADAKLVMINLPDVIPSIVYECPNATSSRFVSSGHNIPGVTGKAFYTGKTNNARLGQHCILQPRKLQRCKRLQCLKARHSSCMRLIVPCQLRLQL